MKASKTARIQDIKTRVNQMIAAPQGTEGGRRALAVFLSSLLMETGNYQGFNYTEWMSGGAARWRADGEPVDKTPYLGDQTRAEYY